MLEVTEIFKSVQGESTHMGLPCVFVRLTGCNLRCGWCDTAYAFQGGKKLSIDEILEEIKSHNIDLIEITGGEPLMQEESILLMETLLKEKFRVMLETGGSLSIKDVPTKGIKMIDLQGPGNGKEGKKNWGNVKDTGSTDEV